MPNKNENYETRDIRDGRWYWIHKAIIQRYTRKIGSTGIAVYNLLASMADQKQKCFPSQKYIAERLGYSRATINKTLKLLERNGLIRIGKKNPRHCVYHLLRCKAESTEMSTGRNQHVKQS